MFEQPRANFEDEAPRKLADSFYSGRGLELLAAEPVQCGWDGDEYVTLLHNGDISGAKHMLDGWAIAHVGVSGNDWWQLPEYGKRNKIIKWVEQNQPADWDPKAPPIRQLEIDGKIYNNSYPSDLHTYVAEALGLDDYSQLELYTAVDTPVDTMYGYDMFFKYRNVRYTIDLTTNLNRKVSKISQQDKADHIITWDFLDEKRVFRKPPQSQVAEEGRQIAKYIKLRIEEVIDKRKKFAA